MTAPLEGVLVVALEQAVAVPFATRQLADLGARVIKIERPGSGDFATLGVLDRATVLDRLARADIASARVNPIEALATHEQLASDERWATTGTEAGPIRTVLPPWLPPGRADQLGDVPALGEHTRSVLEWLGLSD